MHGLGQAHMEGLLQISETKAVLAFQSNSKLTAAMCLLGVDMAWHDKPIKLHVCSPASIQAREYEAARGQHPSGTQAPGPGRDVVSWSSTSDSHLEREPPPPFHMAPRNLNEAQLRQVMENIQQEAARREDTAPHRGSPIWQW